MQQHTSWLGPHSSQCGFRTLQFQLAGIVFHYAFMTSHIANLCFALSGYYPFHFAVMPVCLSVWASYLAFCASQDPRYSFVLYSHRWFFRVFGLGPCGCDSSLCS
ncbi:hypothetical protein BDQ17DRAFT_1373766 [Cyathus striatus]|nr:hypothetical protein BDQ17DRAFT_1381087 [Cyathus striatus]KAF8988931.1 hypothetical protein BDQ17DRAFT_1373766 [Cyathus striatus]